MEIEVEIDQDVFLPCYRHLLDDSKVDIDFLYGSRDSGKSRDTAQRLVKKCMEADYFRHLIIRKTFNTIKDSQWQLIKDIIDDWGLSDLFVFKTNPLEIHCKNGNKFVGRGFDDAQKIKSFQNPSGAWVEEGNELTADDWTVLITSLRSNKGKTKIDVTFNPECDGDYRDFWLYKDWFSHTTNLSFSHTKTIDVTGSPVDIRYRATHTTYNDNPFCSPLRKAIYESLKTTSPYYYRIYAQGLWGIRENMAPFIITFNRDRHVGFCEINRSQIVYLSFDFNRNPMCCSVVQYYDNKVRWLEVIKIPNATIHHVTDYIKIKYDNVMFVVCGDYSGVSQIAAIKNQDINSYYAIIQQELQLTDGQMQYILNPPIEENEVLCNLVLEHVDILLNEATCQPLIFDFQFAEKLPNGKLKKTDRNDPAQQLDALDTFRYFCNRFLKFIMDNHWIKKK
jgi:PBSX family phage terminase large subunit